ncbi:carbamoyltransferase N-terminal domain-containing protein [Nonomuraea sp. NPDC050556]|uniref:carbamoyltransferase N-terminal domain-containing protein n=1 Tax=Nonomuraea sp. NPDC050556 TaxID=3364369 RepID=UPI0037B2067B
MLICGVKVSHDGGIALIDNGQLVASIEVEKVDNGLRYSPLGRLAMVGELLAQWGVTVADVDQFVVDGWWASTTDATEPSVKVVNVAGRSVHLPVAPYVDGADTQGPLHRYEFAPVSFATGTDPVGYSSYHHATNHIMGAYCTSPFAARSEDALVVVWDGGIVPRAYKVSARDRSVSLLAPLIPVVGNIFPDFCAHFEPFRRNTDGMSTVDYMRHHLEIAGKAMAYAALGTTAEHAFDVFDRLFDGLPGISLDNAFLLGEKVTANRDELLPDLSNADIIATFQAYLGQRLVKALTRLVQTRYQGHPPNLVLGGGCALNIKWNSALRATGAFREVWVPPFPNDSGAAIGTACAEMFRTGRAVLDWDVYCGPAVAPSTPPPGWTVRPCDERQLAELLHAEDEPVVVITGRAELGPRALGNRSIIAPATSVRMKEVLNNVKGRAHYRPVAPLCLESRAPEVFDPGVPDPYMLFEHTMRPGWAARVPAVVHLDGTARLQTVDDHSHSPIAAILAEYERLSGIPVLCNTSANLNGHGFFPDVRTAAEWGRCRYIWSDGVLYTHPDSSFRAA